MQIDKNLNRRIENYWDKRSAALSNSRRLELGGADFFAWNKIISRLLPAKKSLKVLDVGCGAGFFPILLSKLGHKVTGIDMSSKMLEEAEKNCKAFNCSAELIRMDAQILNFDAETFDAVISRNLTWTLPDAMEAYNEWHRVLKVGGRLLNFDSDYGRKIFTDKKNFAVNEIEDSLLQELVSIKSSLRISTHVRPAWDIDLLESLGFRVKCKQDISPLVHTDKKVGYDSVPLFAIFAKKIF